MSNPYLEQWTSKEMLKELEEGILNAPQDLLGCHIFKEEDVQIFTAYRPCAKRMWVLDSKGETTYEMEPMEPEGFFGYVIEKKSERLKKYRFRVEYGPDDVIEIDDPYAFPGMFGELDRYLFSEGNHYKIYEKLGAHPMKRDGVEGVQFAVWAPHACSVSVIGEFNMWDARLHKMIMRGSSGIFELFVPGAWEGAAYKYEITAKSGDKLYKTDPYGNYAELRPGNASRITSLDGYKWQDGSYQKKHQKKSRDVRDKEPMSIYEVHLASWKKRIEDDDNGNF